MSVRRVYITHLRLYSFSEQQNLVIRDTEQDKQKQDLAIPQIRRRRRRRRKHKWLLLNLPPFLFLHLTSWESLIFLIGNFIPLHIHIVSLFFASFAVPVLGLCMDVLWKSFLNPKKCVYCK